MDGHPGADTHAGAFADNCEGTEDELVAAVLVVPLRVVVMAGLLVVVLVEVLLKVLGCGVLHNPEMPMCGDESIAERADGTDGPT